MKRILFYILLLFIGTGCRVTQQPVNKVESQPGSSTEMRSGEVLHTTSDSITTSGKEVDNSLNTSLVNRTDSLTNTGTAEDNLSGTTPDMMPDSLRLTDSTLLTNNGTLPADSLKADSIPPKKGALEATVDYQSTDSIVWTAGNMAFLYGEGDVKYQNIELKSEMIQMSMDSSLLYATHGIDSLGEEFGHPVFSEGDQNLEAKEMHYNFKTRKASAKYVVTQQGEGYVTASITKKMENDVMNMEGGRYTTCDEHDHPHFYIRMTKAKVRPGKDIVTGPAYLVIEDVPLFPLVLPFAFFPFTDTYSSGIIMPSYGDDMSRGFFLKDGGYYLALSDYYDLALTGEIYTKGTWGITGKSSYRKRYKYSGNVSVSFLSTATGDKGIDFQKRKDFSVQISHAQDAKANPYRTISASVNYSSSTYDRNQLSSLYTSSGTQNNKSSSVSISQRFPNSPFTISTTMNINQRSQDSSVSVTLPDMNISMSRINPLKRKNATGKERWYEKISINYSAQIKNSISTKEDKLFSSNLIKDWQNGIQHKSSINATYSLFNHINITPSIDYTERWYSHKVEQRYDPDSKKLVPSDTTYGFNRVYNYSASVSASTTLYGMFTPWKPFRKYVTRIRHRMDPSISFGATPDFGDPKYGFYNDYTHTDWINTQPDGTPTITKGDYSPYTGQLFGVPSRGKSGNVSFTLDNNIEAKIRDDNDPSGEKKISLIDKLSGSISYNLVADSCNWTDLNTNLRLKFSKSYTLNLNAVFDTYMYGYDESSGRAYKINKLRIKSGKGIGRLKSTGTSFSYTFNNDTFKKWFGGGSDNNKQNKKRPGDDDLMGEDEYDYDPDDPFASEEDISQETDNNKKNSMFGKKKENEGEYDYDGYYNMTIPWSFSFNYNLAVSHDKFQPEKMEYNYKFVHALSFNGSVQPTKNWRINFNATYDVENKKVSYMTCNISRTMHCFQMSASLRPIGAQKSYTFTISANSSMLKDLKYDQSSYPNRTNSWY